jgi:antitoxin component YwqK of YwqJK toxin-antitoxin module
MEAITKLYGDYENNPSVVFTVDDTNEYIIIMSKLKSTTTNEDRANVIDPKFARFMGSEFMIQCIFRKSDPENELERCGNSYIVGSIIQYDSKPTDITHRGIFYFKTLEAAYYYKLGIPLSGTHKVYTYSGMLIHISTHVCGKLNGEYLDCHPNGQVFEKCYYTDNVKNDGKHVKYYSNGMIMEECNYKNGKRDGKLVGYNDDGTLSFEEHYIDGLLNGAYTEYKNGHIIKISEYRNGKLNGYCIEYSDDGRIVREYNHINNQLDGEFVEYSVDGFMLRKYNYKDGMVNGESIEYYGTSDNKINRMCTYVDRVIHGEYVRYYDNGNVPSKCTYINGEIEGTYTKYNRDGTIKSVHEYVHSEKLRS